MHATVISADEVHIYTIQASGRRMAMLTKATLTMQAAGRRVVDAGTKAIDMLCGLPKLAAIDETVPLAPGLEDVGFRNGGDEHGILTGVPPGKLASSKSPACPPVLAWCIDAACMCMPMSMCAGLLPIGSTVQLAPSHCDPTVNLHEWIVGVRGGVVETTWPIDARGP